MARVREVEFFSTSFLDLLSCGMGAVIVLMIIFVSQLEFAPKDVRGFYMASIEIVENDAAFQSRQVLTLNGEELMRIESTRPGTFSLRLSDGQVIPSRSGQSAKLESAAPGCREVRVGVTVSEDIRRYRAAQLMTQVSVVVKDCRGPQRIELTTERKRLADRLPVAEGGFRGPSPVGWVRRVPRAGEAWAQHWYRYRAGGRFAYATPYPTTTISLTTPLASGRLPESQSPRTTDAMLHMTGWAAQVRVSEALDESTITWEAR